MFLIDFNQVLLSDLLPLLYKSKANLSKDLIRTVILSTLHKYLKSYKGTYQELVVALDDRKYWRKEVFPFYKAHRKKDRENSGLDWNSIFLYTNEILDELVEVFPHQILKVQGAEADDIIAVLTQEFHEKEDILIISSDKDFGQLLNFPNTRQFSPSLGLHVNVLDPQEFLKKQIICGDRGDGIPNILSSDNCFVLGERQKSMTQKRLDIFLGMTDFTKDPVLNHGYTRNQMLIDFSAIPVKIYTSIISEYYKPTKGSMDKLLDYFIQNRVPSELLSSIQDFS